MTIELLSTSLSLRETPAGQSDFATLNEVRSRLRARAWASADDGVTTIFGKTITIVRLGNRPQKHQPAPAESAGPVKLSVCADAQGSPAIARFTLRKPFAQPLRAADQAMYAGWVAAVMCSLTRRAGTPSSDPASITPTLVLRPDSRPDYPRPSPEETLKAFTAPTWRTDPIHLLVQDDLLLSNGGIDLHFPPLRSERAFRADLRKIGSFSGSYLALTDVHGLFSRRVGDTWPPGTASLTERLRSVYCEYLSGRISLGGFLRSAYSHRLALAQDLRTTLLAIADATGLERVSFTRGDGVAAIAGSRAHLDSALGPEAAFREICLPFSVGACQISARETAEDALRRAEFAVAVTKLCPTNPERSLYVYGDELSLPNRSAMQAHLAQPVPGTSRPGDKLARLIERHRGMLTALI